MATIRGGKIATDGRLYSASTSYGPLSDAPAIVSVSPTSFRPGDAVTLTVVDASASGNTVEITGGGFTVEQPIDTESTTEIVFTVDRDALLAFGAVSIRFKDSTDVASISRPGTLLAPVGQALVTLAGTLVAPEFRLTGVDPVDLAVGDVIRYETKDGAFTVHPTGYATRAPGSEETEFQAWAWRAGVGDGAPGLQMFTSAVPIEVVTDVINQPNVSEAATEDAAGVFVMLRAAYDSEAVLLTASGTITGGRLSAPLPVGFAEIGADFRLDAWWQISDEETRTAGGTVTVQGAS